MKIGLIADSRGDVDALEYACDLLLDEKGADRLLFLGGLWNDVDELFKRKRDQERGTEEYGDHDFLADVSSFLAGAAADGALPQRVKKRGVDAFIKRLARVPDKESLAYRDPSCSRVLPDLFGDKIACLVHDKGDLKRDDIEMATFLVHGNSAAPNLVQIGARYFITPGSLTGRAQRTVGLLELEREGGEFVALGLDGRELSRSKFSWVNRRKVSVQ